MKRVSVFLGVLFLVGWSGVVQAAVTRSGHVTARHKPGPVTIRGVAVQVTSSHLTLQTTTRGTYMVSLSANTAVDEKGHRGRVTVADGDHVGVRGLLHGRQITAIHIRIYPVKPKAYSVRGTVTAVRGSELVVDVSGKTLIVHVGASASVRIGSQTGSLQQIRAGDRIDVRVQGTGDQATALHIHIYRSRAAVSHVELRGTVTSVSSGSVAVSSGSQHQIIAVTSGTRVYLGIRHGSLHDVKVGETVRIYAAGAGHSLTATSIHIRQTPVTHTSTLIRGRVTGVSSRAITIAAAHGGITIALTSGTVVDVGATPANAGGIRVGDQVSVRATHSGSTWIATRVHIYAEYRRVHTVSGTVIANTRSGLVVAARGKRYTVSTSHATAISGNVSSVGAIHPGDHVKVAGLLQGASGLVAQRISVKRAVVKLQSVHGTVSQVGKGWLVIVDAYGARHTVRLVSGSHIVLHHNPAPQAALFPGVHATARGHLSGNTLLATTVSLSVTTRSVKGTVTWSSRNRFVVARSAGDVPVDLTPQTLIRDGARALRAVQRGSYVHVHGYAEPTGAVRATSVTVTHPLINTAAVVVATTPSLMVQTSGGVRYRLRLTSRTLLSSGREQITLQPQDIPVGARVHVHGSLASDGSVTVQELDVRLTSLTVRGQVGQMSGSTWTVQVAGASKTVRLMAATIFAQGSHTLTASDVVAGDDVTVYGYGVRGNEIMARKILVHRRLMGVDGTIASLTDDGFVLTASDGSDRVILSPTTLITGGTTADLVAGAAVHVTGYRRGDGVLLATRVRMGKKRSGSSP